MHILIAAGIFIVSYIIQLFLCFKAKGKHAKLILFYLGLAVAFVAFLLYAGVFGEMSMGMLGNGQSLLALVLLIAVIIMFVAIFLAKITHIAVKHLHKVN